jgi:GxxExxY protein
VGRCPDELAEKPEERQEKEKGEPAMDENEIGRIIVDAAIAVHRELGLGLLESVYEAVLAQELRDRGLQVERQVPIPIAWRGMQFEEGFRADLVVEGKVIAELKSVESVTKSHKKQILTHLRLAHKKLGFLLNFGAAVMKEGITRTVNGLEEGG